MSRKQRTLKQTLLRAVVMAVAVVFPAVAYVGGSAIGDVLSNDSVRYVEDHEPWMDEADALAVEYGCSVTGLPDGVIPAHALILLDSKVRLVSFDRGWASYEGTKPGTLMMVCER